MSRPLFRRREIVYVLALTALSLLLMLWFLSGSPGGEALVEQDGRVLDRVSLATAQTREYAGMKISFGPEGAQVLDSDCRDKTCVRTGKITRTGEAAVCLPNRVSVRLLGGEGYDAVTY